jgi:hypothetical protein
VSHQSRFGKLHSEVGTLPTVVAIPPNIIAMKTSMPPYSQTNVSRFDQPLACPALSKCVAICCGSSGVK